MKKMFKTIIISVFLLNILFHAESAEVVLVSDKEPVNIPVPKAHWYNLLPNNIHIPVDPSHEAIYGIEFEIKGTPGISYRPVCANYYRQDGKQRDDPPVRYFSDNCNLLRRKLDATWQKVRLEAMVKKGTYFIGWSIALDGVGEVQVRSARLVEGGFPESPPYVGPPYLDWIESLKAMPPEQRQPFLQVTNVAYSYPKVLWNYGAGEIGLGAGELAQLKEQAKSYLALSPEKLCELMPKKLPPGSFSFSSSSLASENRWYPSEPDVLRDSNSNVIDYLSLYPTTGVETVISPLGNTLSYPYHESGGTRTYLDTLLTRAKCIRLLETAYNMAGIYAVTGETEDALRAGLILCAFARIYPDTPVFGQSSREGQKEGFQPYDNYAWMSFTWGTWYTAGMGAVIHLARIYDLIAGAPVWEELNRITGRDARAMVINDLFLNTAKLTLRYDAFLRPDLWQFFHNTIGSEITAFITVGRAIGCPELAHYAIKKGTCALRYTFMADGMFPESVAYLHDMSGGIGGALQIAEGFSDPKGFTAAVDGRHIEDFKLEKDEPFFKRVKAVRDRLYFPDGTILTAHDTWSNTQVPGKGPVRKQAEPYLLPEFGHAILGQGTKPDWLESHLHYSGCYGHRHFDMLTFTLWAYGDEQTADIGYSHIGGYESTTLSHNLVVVDEKLQQWTNYRGDLLAWYPNPDACQVAQATGTNAYPQTERYRRAIINVPFAPGKDAVVDIFETRGGRRHDWMANGCADYEQTVETTLTDPVKKLPNLAPDGQALLINMTNHVAGVPDELYLPRNKISPYYGAFTDASFYRNEKPWSLTMKPCPPVPAGTPGAGPRAVVTNEVRPGLRLHWLAPLDGEAIVCKAPRQRYRNELQHEKEAWEAWNKNLMPKVIVRREAKAETPLDSTFVTAWEPFREAPWLEQVTQLPVEESAGVGVRLAGAGNEAVVLYRKPEYDGTLRVKVSPEQKTGKWNRLMKWLGCEGSEVFAGDGRFVILRRAGGHMMLDLYDGSLVQFGRLTARLKPLPPMKLLAIEQAGEEHSLIVEGIIPSYPPEASGQPHAGQFIKFCQPGQVPRWLPLARVEKQGEGKSRLVLTREPGFEYDVSQNVLKETYFPFQILTGPTNQGAVVQFPDWLNMKWEPGKEGEKVELNASGDVVLEFKGLGKVEKAQISKPDSKTTADLPVTSNQEGQICLEVPSTTLGKGWNIITLGK